MKDKEKNIPESILESIKKSSTALENFARTRVHTLELKHTLHRKEREIEHILAEVRKHPGHRGTHTGTIYRKDIEEVAHQVAVLKYQCHNLENELRLQ